MTEKDSLLNKKCQPCEGEGSTLTVEKANEFLRQVSNWQINKGGLLISREYTTKNFMAAIRFINKVADLAEDENHHPDIILRSYRKLRIELTTHAIGGLSENDFILAAKINQLPIDLKD